MMQGFIGDDDDGDVFLPKKLIDCIPLDWNALQKEEEKKYKSLKYLASSSSSI